MLGLALIGSMASAPEAGAAKLTACVKKKSGAMRLVSGKKAKKKCPKGWRKVTWEKGKGVAPLKVVAADGKVVGTLVGMVQSGPVSTPSTFFATEASTRISAAASSFRPPPWGQPDPSSRQQTAPALPTSVSTG